jgi:hypothetical protein
MGWHTPLECSGPADDSSRVVEIAKVLALRR